jgi:5-methylcytosine-specific restriction endonuclease McrA
MRHRLGKRDGWTCHYCGIDLWCSGCVAPGPQPKATIDHVVPHYLGGSNKIENLVLACSGCNQDKGNLRLEDWLAQRAPEPEPADEPERELPDLDTGLDTLRAMWNGRRSD